MVKAASVCSEVFPRTAEALVTTWTNKSSRTSAAAREKGEERNEDGRKGGGGVEGDGGLLVISRRSYKKRRKKRRVNAIPPVRMLVGRGMGWRGMAAVQADWQGNLET